MLEKGSERGSLGKPPPAPSSQSLQTHAHTLTLKHCPRKDRHSREDLALPVLDSSHPHPCAWCERRSPGTRSALSHRKEGDGHARRRCSLGVSRWHGVPSSRAARLGTSQLGGAGPGRVCGWRCRARRRPCTFLPSPVRRHRLGESLGTAPGHPSPLRSGARQTRPGRCRGGGAARCGCRKAKAARIPQPQGRLGPRCRTERPLTAEQQQQQQ